MAVLPGVLGCRPLRRTVRVRLGTNPAVPRDELPGGTSILFALAPLRSVPHRKRHLRQAGSQLRGLATAIHKISGLANESGVFLAGLNEVNLFRLLFRLSANRS